LLNKSIFVKRKYNLPPAGAGKILHCVSNWKTLYKEEKLLCFQEGKGKWCFLNIKAAKRVNQRQNDFSLWQF
jgi:hypothetical protein